MRKVSLTRRIECCEQNRVADPEAAKRFLEMAAARSLEEYFRKNMAQRNFVIEALWPEEIVEWTMYEEESKSATFGGACRRFVEKYGNREESAAEPYLLLQALACRYARPVRIGFPKRAEACEASEKSEEVGGIFRRESLGERIRSIKKTSGQESGRKEVTHRPAERRLSDYYAWIEEHPASSADIDTFVVARINVREYFQAVSLITGKKEDAGIPEMLYAWENRGIGEVLGEGCESDEAYMERIYRLLIEPFAKISG